jgi:hypothetical protein
MMSSLSSITLLLVAFVLKADAFSTITSSNNNNNGIIRDVGSRTTSLFSSKTTARRYESTESRSIRTARSSSKLNMVGRSPEMMDPYQILPLGEEKTSITPEGFGFSSPVSRVINIANRNGGFYKAKESNIVTDVMDEITNGVADVALVFEDDNGVDGEYGKIKGIFTESDYIKVRNKIIRYVSMVRY